MGDFIDLHRNAETAIRMVREAKELGYDTETSGLDWRRNVPVGYVFTVIDEAVTSLYVPVRHGGGGNLMDPTGQCQPLTVSEPESWHKHPFEIELAKAFEERRAKKLLTVGHNIQFDCHASATADIYLGRDIACTQNRQTLIDEYTKGFTLEELGKYWKVTAKKGQEMYEHLGRLFNCPPAKDLMGRYWETSGVDPVAYDYAAGDGITTLEVFAKQQGRVEKEDLQVINELESQLIWTIFRMERRGIDLDMDYLKKLVRYLEEKVKEARLALPDGFNPRSPNQMKALMEEHGHTDWPMTEPSKTAPNGNPSFTAKWLEGHEIGRSVVALRQWSKLLSTDILPLIETHAFNGRVNPAIRQNASDDGGTISGRLAVGKPPMQAIPKHNKPLAAKMRRGFKAPEGYKLYEADYAQLEPRLYAHYSKDENLLAGYTANPPVDVHTMVANMLHVDRGTTGKRMNMGMFTGMQARTFSNHMEMPLSEATDLWRRWMETFPGVPKFQNQAKSVLASRGYVKTILGRRGRLENYKYAYKAASKVIQGGNADIIKLKMVEVDRRIEEENIDYAWLVMSIHDALMWVAEDSPRGEEFSRWVVERMQDGGAPLNLRVPLVVEMDCGDHWAEASFGDKGRAFWEEVENAVYV